MEKEQRWVLIRVIVSGILLIACWLLPIPQAWRFVAFLLPYGIVAYDVLYHAVLNTIHGELFDECFLMGVATIGAFVIGKYAEAVAVMLFYQVGELCSDLAVDRSRRSIAELMDIRPDHATVERGGRTETVPPDTVAAGEILVIRPGEKIPLDGTVLEGTSSINTMPLTGEALPRDVAPGSEVISGCINLRGVLRVSAVRPYAESTVSKILNLVENSAKSKARSEQFITRFSKVYTPVVVGGAVLLAVIPPLILGGGWTDWIRRALLFLVVSCPCALVVSVPLSFFGGIGGASRHGILIKGATYLEQLSRACIAVFDKTGTLTRGTFSVTAVHPQDIPEAELLELAAYAEAYSDHPIAISLRQAYHRDIDAARIENALEDSGHGVYAVIDGRRVDVGNVRLMERVGVTWRACHHAGTIVHVAVDGVYMGHIVISDTVKQQSAAAIADVKRLGVRKIVMLTGDRAEVASHIGNELGIDETYAELLPQDKVQKVEELLGTCSKREKLLFVGDGINDAPVLARADVGVAMGALGSDSTIEAADIVLMDDNPEKLTTAIRLSRRTMRIVRENIVFALSVKGVILIAGALGIATMWAAVFADVGVTVLAVLNAMRALRVPGDRGERRKA